MIEVSKYVHEYVTDEGELFGLRRAHPSDAEGIAECFKSVYGMDYLYPTVYDAHWLRRQVTKKGQYWYVAEKTKEKDIAGIGRVEIKGKNSAYFGKFLIKRDYQGKGVGGAMGTVGQLHAWSSIRKEMKDIMRMDNDVRARNATSQRVAHQAGTISYAFLPNYNNYGNKTKANVSLGPFSSGKLEAVFLNFLPLKKLWQSRENHIYLLEDPTIDGFYEIMQKRCRKMRKDILHHEVEDRPMESLPRTAFKITEDRYKACVKWEGYLPEKNLLQNIDEYGKWNCIEWLIPTTPEGLDAQQLAIKHGFVVVGYNPGSFNFGGLYDTVVLGAWPTGIDESQFEGIDIIKQNKPIYDLFRESMERRKSQQ